MLRGIDISNWQGQPDYNKLKLSQGFIGIRSSYGDGYTDPQFARNRDNVRNLQIPHLFYHYAYPQYNAPVNEAKWFLKVVNDIRDGEILVLDFEEHYSGDVVVWCKAFLDYVYSQLKYKPLIYLNLSQTKNYNWKPVIDAGYGLWLALYDQNPNSTNWDTPWPVTAMRQWSSIQKVDGIVGNVDADVFYGDSVAFGKYGYSKPVPPNYQLIAQQVKEAVNNTDVDSVKVTNIQKLVANV